MSLTRVQDVSVEDIYKRKKPRKHYVYSIHVYWQDGPIAPVYRSYNTLLELQERLLRIKEFLQNQKEDEISTSLLKGQKLSDRFTIKKRAKALRRLPAVEEFLKAVVHLPSPISESDPVINFFHPLLDDLTELDYEQKELYYSLENVRHTSKHKYIHHISEPILVEQYLVIADYIKQEDSDINLKAGNVVDVIEKNEHGWWFVDLDGEVGWAPASYLEPRDGSMDDQVLEVFEDGEEETYITTAAYEPELEDEIKLERGKIVKVIQKNLDGWWLVKIEKNEGWAPAMFLREIATSRRNAREKGQHAVRAMLRDRLNTISAMTGRRQTWEPPKRKKSVKRNIPVHGTDQTESRASIKPTYVNLEFHEAMKRQAAGRGRTRQKLDPNEVRAGARLQPSNGVIHDKDNASNGSLKPRPLSMVEEESPETVSRGTSPIPRTLLCRNSKPSSTPSSEDDVFSSEDDVFCPIDLSECPDKEMGASDSLEDSNNETEEDEGEEYTENMPELVTNRFYAMGSYEKEDDEEVNLRENAEVEVLKESDGGWWLVRTSSHSVGWAPSNFLEKVQSLRRRSTDDTKGTELSEHDEMDILEVIPVRPPKSPRILKMARDMCIEKEFWQYIQKGEDKDTYPLDERQITNEIPSEEDTGKHQSHLETKSDNKEVMAFTFDDYECDPNTEICLRRGHKTTGHKYVPTNNAPTQEIPKDILEVNNNVIERSESVPSLAESEDLDDDDDDYEQIKI